MDKHTTGLILLTNSGELVNALHPVSPSLDASKTKWRSTYTQHSPSNAVGGNEHDFKIDSVASIASALGAIKPSSTLLRHRVSKVYLVSLSKTKLIQSSDIISLSRGIMLENYINRLVLC